MNKIEENIIQLGKKLGVPVVDRSHYRNYSFDGKTIARFEDKNKLRSIANIVHDIAHWIVASKQRRKMKEFGLGDSPDPGTQTCNMAVGYPYAQTEEARASMLGIMIERELGSNWQATWVEHCWEDDRYSDPIDFISDYLAGIISPSCDGHHVLNYLVDHKYLTDNLIPTCTTRI